MSRPPLSHLHKYLNSVTDKRQAKKMIHKLGNILVTCGGYSKHVQKACASDAEARYHSPRQHDVQTAALCVGLQVCPTGGDGGKMIRMR